ncbi:MAG: metallophosphoesterase [bacterium]
MYDIIGDVHGKADALKDLLLKMGYRKSAGYYSHPERKAIFTGDIINRGKKVRQSLKIVKRMVDNKSAYAVMGNHEYNLICYHTRSLLGRGYLKKHNQANRTLFYQTTRAFIDHPGEWEEYLDWMKQLPLFLEFEHFRVVHACWDKRIIKFVKRNLPGNRMTEVFLQNSARDNTIENDVIKILLTGVEIPVDKLTTVINSNGSPVDNMRIKWWLQPENLRLGEVAFGEYKIKPNRLIKKGEKEKFIPYSRSKRPVFIGHYCLREEPGLQSDNVCCVDYCCYRNGKLASYRMQGESRLVRENIVAV